MPSKNNIDPITMRPLDISVKQKFRENSEHVNQTRELLRKSVKASYQNQRIDTPLEVELGWTEKEFYLKNKNGVHGRTGNAEKIEMLVNTDVEGWQGILKNHVAHEYGHSYFFDITGLRYESDIENWRHILLEAHGQLFSEKVYPGIDAAWRTQNTREEIADKWEEIRPKFGNNISSDRLVNSRDYPVYFGYSLSYHVGQQLSKDHHLENFPYLEKEDVIEAGNELFD